jgi:hypothetical protein
MRLRSLVVPAVAAVLVAAPAMPTLPAVPSGTYEYDIRHPMFGRIGTHTAEFSRSGDDLIVATRIHLSVGVAMVHLYTFESEGREVWRAGRLVEASAVTNDNGKRISVSAHAEGDRFVVDGPTGRTEASGPVGTTTFWNAQAVSIPLLMEPTSGLFYKVGIKAAGRDRIRSTVRTYDARKYTITGEITGDLWYADDGTWVRMDFEKYGAILTVTLATIRR